jgi:hypothetical protein
MSAASRPVSTGKTRTCPHCKATILESLSICPGCMHHLRFDSEAAKRQVAAAPALRVEGIIRHPPLEQPLEYFVIIAIRNDRGEEVTRQVVNVGALQAAEKRTFTLSVEVLPPAAPVTSKSASSTTNSTTSSTGTASTGTFKSPVTPSSATVAANPGAATVKPTAAGPAAPGSGLAPSATPKSGSNLNPLAPNPTSAKPAGGLRSGNPPGGTNPAGSNPPGSNPNAGTAAPGSAANPATAPKPASGYTLKPPSPGGPKRH